MYHAHKSHLDQERGGKTTFTASHQRTKHNIVTGCQFSASSSISRSKVISFKNYCPDTKTDRHAQDRLLYLDH